MKVLGLTGGLASGKSTVASLFQKRGAYVIDADLIARQILEPGQAAYQKVVEAFGPDILTTLPHCAMPPISRERLADLVFKDPILRKKLNEITHPEIRLQTYQQIQKYHAQGANVILYEAALLVETGGYKDVEGLIVVDIPVELQLKRAVDRGLTLEQAKARISAQASREERLSCATWVIDNRGSLEETERQVQTLWDEFTH